MNARLRGQILEFLDGLEPPVDRVSPVFMLAPTHLDSADYRLGWEACASECKGFFLPIVGFTREYWRERRERATRDKLEFRQRRHDCGMCTVATCDARATDGERCAKHASEHRANASRRQRERRDRIRSANENQGRLLDHLRHGPGKRSK